MAEPVHTYCRVIYAYFGQRTTVGAYWTGWLFTIMHREWPVAVGNDRQHEIVQNQNAEQSIREIESEQAGGRDSPPPSRGCHGYVGGTTTLALRRASWLSLVHVRYAFCHYHRKFVPGGVRYFRYQEERWAGQEHALVLHLI